VKGIISGRLWKGIAELSRKYSEETRHIEYLWKEEIRDHQGRSRGKKSKKRIWWPRADFDQRTNFRQWDDR
jgi:hypothetical protein